MGTIPGRRAQQGALMIEVLITIVICVIGLYGLMNVQGRLQVSEMESYQRSQAVLLLDDLASRLVTNRSAAASYITTAASPLGVGSTCPTATTTLADRDLKEWCESLQGAAETFGGSQVGSMIGARGCVEDMGSDQYMITVAWQGMVPISAPPASVACAKNSYDTAGADCDNDLCRRVATTLVRIADLTP